MRKACSVGCEASTTAAGSLRSLPGFAYSGCCCDIVHTAPLTSSAPRATPWAAVRIAVFIGEDSFDGGACNGLSDFFTGSPGISAARTRLNEGDENPSLLIAVRPAQPIRKTVQYFHIPLTNAVLRCCRRKPVRSDAVRRRQFLHLHSSLHQLRASGLGEVPHSSTDLRVRQRTFGISTPDIPDEVLVIDHLLLITVGGSVSDANRCPRPRWCLPALQILGFQ